MTTTGREDSARTCAGCRGRDNRDALLRFVTHDGPPWLVPDIGRRLPGRGVSVHPRRSCLQEAARRGFARSLKRAVSADAEELGRLAAEQYRRRAIGLLLAARRAKAL